jgi:DNA-binding Lrp family transcriptional regulator
MRQAREMRVYSPVNRPLTHGTCKIMPIVHDPETLDSFDLKLLAALQEDGRLTNAELGDRIGLSASQCSRRRIKLEESGIIKGYQARIDAERVGLPVMALVQVTLGTHSNDNARKFAGFVNSVPAIQDAYAVTGDSDYMLTVVVASLPDLARLVSDTILVHPTVSHVKSSIVLSRLKAAHRLPLG